MHYNHLQLSKTLWGIQQTIVCFFIILLSFAQFCFPFILFHLHKVDKTIRTNKFCKATSEFRTGFHQFMPEAWLEQYICHFRRFLVPMFVASNVGCFGVVLSDVWHSVICRSNVCRFFVCRSDVCNFVPMFVVLTFVVTMFVFPTFDFWTFAIPTFLCVPNTFMHAWLHDKHFKTNKNSSGTSWEHFKLPNSDDDFLSVSRDRVG